MSASLKLTNAKALQSFIRTFQKTFLSLLYSNFDTAKYVTHHAMTKGEKVLTQILIGDIVKRWSKTFDPVADAVDFNPRTLYTKLVKADIEIFPQEFFDTYLGQMYQGAIDPKKIPFHKAIFMEILKKIASEQEYAAWWGEEAAVPASTDLLKQVVDGYGTKAKAEATAGNLTVTATGAINSTNAVDAVETVYLALDKEIRKGAVAIFMTNGVKVDYLKDYRNKYGAKNLTKDYLQFDLSNKAKIIEIPGDTDFVMCTPTRNMHYGYQLPSDEMFRFKDEIRSIQAAMDFRIGFEFGIADPAIISLNDQ